MLQASPQLNKFGFLWTFEAMMEQAKTEQAMTAAQTRAALVQRLAEPRVIVAPGVFDTLSAVLAEQAGFEALFFSGSAVSYSQLALPDIGLITLPELLAS